MVKDTQHVSLLHCSNFWARHKEKKLWCFIMKCIIIPVCFYETLQWLFAANMTNTRKMKAIFLGHVKCNSICGYAFRDFIPRYPKINCIVICIIIDMQYSNTLPLLIDFLFQRFRKLLYTHFVAPKNVFALTKENTCKTDNLYLRGNGLGYFANSNCWIVCGKNITEKDWLAETIIEMLSKYLRCQRPLSS